MKKLLALVLALLMLCGCGTEHPDTPDTTPATQTPTEEVIVNHEALEIRDLSWGSVYAAASMDNDILLFTGDHAATLVKLDGRKLKEEATLALNLRADPADPAVQVSGTGLSYCHGSTVVFLDEDLQEVSRVDLPENMTGSPAVTADLNTIYYATRSAIRAIDRETGLDRLLREISFSDMTISALHLNDTVLECLVRNEDGSTSTLFFSTGTGELLEECLSELTLASDGDLWLATVNDGGYSQTIFAAGDGEIRALIPAGDTADLHLIPGLQDVLAVTYSDGVTSLGVCDTESGVMTAAVSLEGNPSLAGIWGDEKENCIWLILDGKQLCRWDLDKSAAGESVSCIGPYYTRENPDAEGMAALKTAAAELESTYGVAIHIAEDAVAVQPADVALISEYQVDLLEDGLSRLAEALAHFSPEFLAGVGRASDDGTVHISLVRAMESSPQCLQFWDDEGDAYIVLAVGNSLEQDFYHGLAHIIDARVMTKGTTFDSWDRLNPKGFDYTYDYLANPTWDDSIHAGAFIDSYAMTFPTEDRARVFEYAMMAGCESHFESETMQKKLSTLCTGIRKAFGLTGSDAELPWEQYLAD